MDVALALARRGLGQVAPNPAVGCIILRGGKVVGRGWTQPQGRPHAETEALRRAGEAARGSTAYVTLEPCNHHGRTPPCSEALIAAGVARCVIAMEDPDSRVAGRGAGRLRDAGVSVTVGTRAAEAAEVNAGYLLNRRSGRPLVTLKLATSLDGKIATRSGESQWITGGAARARGHLFRANHDAVMVGGGTAVSDNPRLTARLPGLEGRGAPRIVLDGSLALPLTHHLVAEAAQNPTWLVTRKDAARDRCEAYRNAGVEVIKVGVDAGKTLDLQAVFRELGRRGMTRVMVEGGGRLAAGLLRADLVDRLVWFHTGCVIGGDGIPAVAGFGLEKLAAAPRFTCLERVVLGDDSMEIYRRGP